MEKDIYVDFGISLQAALSAGSVYMHCYWADGALHNFFQRDTDGLKCYYGPADISKETVCCLRGKTVRLYCHSGGHVYLGASGSTAITSDENLKYIYDMDNRYVDFFNKIVPVLYKYKNRGHRYHLGFGARQIEKALVDSGLTTEEFAGIIKEKDVTIGADEAGTKEDVHYDELYSLRYEEFIALNTNMIKLALNEIDQLKQQIKELKGE